MQNNIYDVVIIGRGPAGISAALYTARANLSTLVVGTDASILNRAMQIENYYGFEQPVSGAQLLEAGVMQAQRVGAVLVEDEVTAVDYAENGYTVKTDSDTYTAKAVLIATGQVPRRPSIAGVEDWEGKGVSYCTTCDGFFFKDKHVGVLGNGNFALQEAMELEAFTDQITLFTNGQELDLTGKYTAWANKYPINTAKVSGLEGKDKLSSVVLEEGRQLIDGLFIASGTASSVDFATKLGVLVQDESIVVDSQQRTNLEGIFAAGDCTGGFRQVSIAVGQGAMAGKEIIEYVKQHSQAKAAH